MSGKQAIILLSGGLDSVTTLAWAKSEGYVCHALSFDYGQRHKFELDYARKQAALQGVASHRIVQIDLRSFGGSALTDDTIEVPKNRDTHDENDIPVTYVPARNTIFLSYALAFAEVTGALDIFIGANRVDYSGYPDCRPEFIKAFEAMANLAVVHALQSDEGLRIQAPLLDLSKADIVKKGVELGVDYSQTISCYDPDEAGRACGECDACQLRRAGFAANGMADPALAS